MGNTHYRRLAGLVSAAGLTLAAASLVANPAGASTTTDGAVFVQTDNTAGNAVVAYDRNSDGSLTQAATYATGGVGGVLDGSVVDHTASQGALVLDRERQLLYVVNAGSNTITIFAVQGDRLVRRQILSSGGDFPVSVAVHGDLVYVLNARSGGSIQGYQWSPGGATLVKVPVWHRALGLDTTATPEFVNTPGQIAFTPDGSKLVVTTKANGNDIDVFNVGLSGPSAHSTVNVEAGAVPFAVAFDPSGHLVVAEVGTNAIATFTIHSDGTVTQIDRALTGQAGTCWVTANGSRFYASNTGSASVSSYSVSDGGALTGLGNTSTDAGTVDSAVSSDGHYLYVQGGAKGVVDAYQIGDGGSLTSVGTVTVPDAAGAEGIAAS